KIFGLCSTHSAACSPPRRGRAAGSASRQTRKDDEGCSRPSRLRRQDVEDDREEVADAPAEDEEVPDGVAVRDSLGGAEDDARRVGESAGDDPQERTRGDGREYRLGRDDAQPAE